jgi:hypothetical protein
MANKTIAAWAQENGLALDGSSALSEENGYIITYSYTPESRSYSVSVAVKEENWSKEKQKELKKSVKNAGRLLYGKSNSVQVLISGLTSAACRQKFRQATQILLEELPRLGIGPCEACHYCGEGGCDGKVLSDGICYPAHTRCKENKADEILAEIEYNQEHGSMPLGLAGAVLGGLIGSVPSFLTAHFMDTIYALLFALIPLAAYGGYKLCKGLMNAAVPFIVSVISLLSTVVLVISYEYAALYQYLSEDWPTLEEDLAAEGYTAFSFIMELMLSEEFRFDLIAEMAMPILFCGVGIFAAWSQISKNNRHKRKEAEKLAAR